MAGITPWYTGQLLPVWTISLVDDNGNPVNLTGAQSVALSFMRADNVETAGAGVAGFGSPLTGGQVTYAPAAADVTTAGMFRVFVKVTFSGGLLISDPIPWTLVQS